MGKDIARTRMTFNYTYLSEYLDALMAIKLDISDGWGKEIWKHILHKLY